MEEATSAVVSVTFRRSRLAPLVTEVYISLVSHESLTERVQAVECIHGGVELLTGQNPVSGSPQPLSVRQLRARRLERIGRLLVEAERLLKVQGEVGVFGEQPTATERAGERPWLPFGSRSGRELCGGPLRVVVTA